MLSEKNIGKKINDNIFNTSARAKEAAKVFGKENVINGTIGSLFDENEKLATYEVVENVFRNLDSEDLFAYASSFIGEKDFLEEVKKTVLGENYKKNLSNLYFDSISTPGGTGAITSTIKNYLDHENKVLVPNLMWGSYKNIILEHEGKPELYNLIDENQNFDIENLKQHIENISAKQRNTIIIVNDPCHNPTGMRLTYEEWKKLFEILKEACKKTNIILIRDVAYFEYDTRTEDEIEKINLLMKDIPKNLLVVFTFSLSKSMSMYGLRIGAQVAVSSSKEIIDEFHDAAAFTARVTWSNTCKGGMKTFTKIMSDETLKQKYFAEKKKYITMLNERAEIFTRESRECNLDIFPYKSGFFITIQLGEKVDEIMNELEKNNIFGIKFGNAIRIGLCSIPKRKVTGLAKRIKKIIENF